MNMVLEKRERVTMGGKGRSEIRGQARKVTRMVLNAPIMDSLGKKI